MEEFRDRINGETDEAGLYYKLAIDLNLSEKTDWEAIGKRDDCAFKGHFDGNNKTIKIKISDWIYKDKGPLFGHIKTESGYAIKNLNVSGSVEDNLKVGGIAQSLSNSSIENCTFTGTLSSNSDSYLETPYTGGIVCDMISGTIKNCKVQKAKIKSTPAWYDEDNGGYSGGIVAKMASGTIENCIIDKDSIISGISGTGGSAGTSAARITVGGIVGYLNKSAGVFNRGSITSNDCHAQVEGNSENYKMRLGGIVGTIEDSNVSITNNNYDGSISASGKYSTNVGTPHIGGIIGEIGVSSPTISGNTFSGAEYGIGWDASGEPSNTGCTKISGGGTGTEKTEAGETEKNIEPEKTGTPEKETGTGGTGTGTGGTGADTGDTGTGTEGTEKGGTEKGTGTGTTGGGSGTTTNNGNGTVGSSGGGGGCNMGFGLLILGIALIFRRK